MNAQKVVVIGLDGASPDLLFGKYRNDLPNIKALMNEGFNSPLQSTIPPITVPAWLSMFTGKDPGTLGIYSFHNRKYYDYGPLQQVSSLDVCGPTVWEQLSNIGKRSVVIGVPVTYPPKRLNPTFAL
jgi:predicted AlkP superfamily phosphohydrolase/phosphomutase